MTETTEDYGDGCACMSDDCPECGTRCTWCGGDAYDECTDPIQCCSTHVYGLCPCSACRGTGLRSQQVIF